MNITYYYEDGTKVPDGVAIRPLAQRVRLTVEIDSASNVDPSVVMNHLKKRWGVNEVKIDSVMVTCQGGTSQVPKPRT